MRAHTSIEKLSSTPTKEKIDPFSDVIRLMGLQANICHNIGQCKKQNLNTKQIDQTCFYFVTNGYCSLDVPGHIKTNLNKGDLIILPSKLNHSLSPINSCRSDIISDSFPFNCPDGDTCIKAGILCGQVKFTHQASNFLLNGLPKVIILKNDKSYPWLMPILDMMLIASRDDTIGAKEIKNKLSEVLFTFSLRQYYFNKKDTVGLLALYSHEKLKKTVEAIHNFPERKWTLKSMSCNAALSRTAFTETFKNTSGWTPGNYLKWFRMNLAWSLLSEGKGITEVAMKVGYKSDAAFSRAFHDFFSVPPGKIRRQSNPVTA